MKNNQQQVAGNSISSLYKSETPKEFVYHMPPGAKFSDILMDVQEVCQELHMSRRKVYNLRRAGILSYTSLSSDGKIYFFRQEIAAMLEANTVIGKNSLMKKLGVSGWLTGITSFLSLFDFQQVVREFLQGNGPLLRLIFYVIAFSDRLTRRYWFNIGPFATAGSKDRSGVSARVRLCHVINCNLVKLILACRLYISLLVTIFKSGTSGRLP